MHIHQTISLTEDDCVAEIYQMLDRVMRGNSLTAAENTNVKSRIHANLQDMANEAFELGRKAGRVEFGHG